MKEEGETIDYRKVDVGDEIFIVATVDDIDFNYYDEDSEELEICEDVGSWALCLDIGREQYEFTSEELQGIVFSSATDIVRSQKVRLQKQIKDLEKSYVTDVDRLKTKLKALGDAEVIDE